ncbi:dihydrolipoyl dehydrogenase [Polaromonas sp. DSR2-3-2]|uniref:dihydrolipoyl dehydrogenase n=1 Tax=unclassified Polaromonas TaxID=2638319 RepID=UPI003CEC66CB
MQKTHLKSTITTDIAVIGAGTAGLAAFHEISRAGRSALLIDRGPLGTTCARVGCMPSKAALHAGEQWATLSRLAPGGLPSASQTPDGLWQRARATRNLLAQGVAEQTVAQAGDRLVMGEARFLDAQTLDVGGQRICAKAFVIATGSRPVLPKFLSDLGSLVVTTDTLFELEKLPRSIGILGLGAIGLEMGLALARLGVRVVAGDLKSTPAGITDPEVRARALELFSPELTTWLGHPVEVELVGDALHMRSGEASATVDLVLAALGRQPNVEQLDLANAGITLDSHGQPVVDSASLRAAGKAAIFLAGDVTPDRPLMHEAIGEGVMAARGALRSLNDGFEKAVPPRRAAISIVFSNPDVAAVGMAYDHLDMSRTVIGTAQGTGNGRSRILGAEGNLVRVYVDRHSGVLLGSGLVAVKGEHLAHALAWAVQRGDTVESLLAMPYYHPSIEEMLQSALKDAARQMAANRHERASARF